MLHTTFTDNVLYFGVGFFDGSQGVGRSFQMGFFDVESPESGTLEVVANFTTRDDNTWLDGEHTHAYTFDRSMKLYISFQ